LRLAARFSTLGGVNHHSLKSGNLRKGRFSEVGRIYFVTACCYRQQRHFSDDRAAKILYREFCILGNEGACDNLAFVVMPDHFHWLVQLNGESSLSQSVRLLKGRSARKINREKSSGNRTWHPGFYDRAIRREENIEAAANYLIHNPLRARLVDRVDAYPYWWSVWHPRFAAKAAPTTGGCRG
jgi:REP element-mobilizing transposase RayT